MLSNVGIPGLITILLLVMIPILIIYRAIRFFRARSQQDQQFQEQVLNRIDSLEQTVKSRK